MHHQRLLHAHVVRFREAFAAPPYLCIAMEYVAGAALRGAGCAAGRWCACGCVHRGVPFSCRRSHAAAARGHLSPRVLRRRVLQQAATCWTSSTHSRGGGCWKTRRGTFSSSWWGWLGAGGSGVVGPVGPFCFQCRCPPDSLAPALLFVLSCADPGRRLLPPGGGVQSGHQARGEEGQRGAAAARVAERAGWDGPSHPAAAHADASGRCLLPRRTRCWCGRPASRLW